MIGSRIWHPAVRGLTILYCQSQYQRFNLDCSHLLCRIFEAEVEVDSLVVEAGHRHHSHKAVDQGGHTAAPTEPWMSRVELRSLV